MDSIYVNSNAVPQNRTEFNNYREYLVSNMGKCQLAIEVPAPTGGHYRIGITGITGVYHSMASLEELEDLSLTVDGKQNTIIGTTNRVIKKTVSGVATGSIIDSDTRIISLLPFGVGGDITPQNKLHIHETSQNNVFLQITNTNTGNSDNTDGFIIGISGNDKVFKTGYQSPFKFQYENPSSPGNFIDIAKFDYSMSFLTSEYFTINASTTINNSLEVLGNLTGTTASFTGDVFVSRNIIGGDATALIIQNNTTNGADNKYVCLGFGDVARSGYIVTFGNKHSNTGLVKIVAGVGNGTTTGAINLVSKVYCGDTRPSKDYYKLAIDNTFQFDSFVADMTDITAVIQQNNYFDGTNYRFNGAIGASLLSFANGEIKLRTTPSTTLNGVITWNEGIKVDKSGKVGFGVSSTLVEKVEVNGNIKASGSVKAIDFGDSKIILGNFSYGYCTYVSGSVYVKREGKILYLIFDRFKITTSSTTQAPYFNSADIIESLMPCVNLVQNKNVTPTQSIKVFSGTGASPMIWFLDKNDSVFTSANTTIDLSGTCTFYIV